jgi:hypothetical protein
MGQRSINPPVNLPLVAEVSPYIFVEVCSVQYMPLFEIFCPTLSNHLRVGLFLSIRLSNSNISFQFKLNVNFLFPIWSTF